MSMIYGMIENKDMEMFFCRINKAGITSTMKFFSSMNRNRTLRLYFANMKNGSVHLHLNTNDFKRARPGNHGIGIDHRSRGTYIMIKTMPLEPAIKMYYDYHKLLIVRHPLQRLVSAYFQILKLRKKEESFGNFVKRDVLKHENEHWLDYQSSCHPCVMGYDFILQQENIDKEFPYFSERLGLATDYPYPKSNVNGEADNPNVYRYDNILSGLEKDDPDLFSRMLNKYQVDMDMFGYYWRNHSSGRLHDGLLC